MIKFDLALLDNELYKNNLLRKEEIFDKFNNSNMIGWMREVSQEEVSTILKLSDEIKKNADCLVVIGIGGSYLGSFSLNKIFKKDDSFEVVYLGNNLSREEISKKLDYLAKKNFYINVVSKSGTTMEIKISYDLIKDLMKKKYNDEEIKKRIIITTDKEKGKLREECRNYGYRSLVIDNDIGGRYSLITAGHLLPLALNIDIEELIRGYYKGIYELKEEAYKYACLRRSLFEMGKYISDFKYKGKKLDDINNLVLDSVVEAHTKNNVFCNVITLDKITENNMGALCAFFMLSAAYSGYLFDVFPFDQPGVEVYKECVRKRLEGEI